MMKYYYVPFVRPGSSCNRGSVIAFWPAQCNGALCIPKLSKTDAITKPLT